MLTTGKSKILEYLKEAFAKVKVKMVGTIGLFPFVRNTFELLIMLIGSTIELFVEGFLGIGISPD